MISDDTFYATPIVLQEVSLPIKTL